MSEDYGKCQCCGEKDALTYCDAKAGWTCEECFVPQNEFPYHLSITKLTARDEMLTNNLERAIELLKSYYVNEWHGIGCPCKNCKTNEFIQEMESGGNHAS